MKTIAEAKLVLGKDADLGGLMKEVYYDELVNLDAVFTHLIDHSGLLMVALLPREPSCFCFLLDLPFSY